MTSRAPCHDGRVTSALLPAHPAAQSKYQVRFDWGVDGAERIAAGADVVVVVDVLGGQWRPVLDAGERAETDAQRDALLAALPPRAAVLSAGFGTASAAARWITEHQHALGRRAMIAIVAAGGVGGGEDAGSGIRFAVENQLAAGALIDALATLGIDFCSPEAAASCAAFTGLRGAEISAVRQPERRAVGFQTLAQGLAQAACCAGQQQFFVNLDRHFLNWGLSVLGLDIFLKFA